MSRASGMRGALLVGLVGAVVWGVGLVVAPDQAWRAYLAAVMTTLTIALGALSLILMAHLTGATWFVVLRRAAESVAGSLPALAVLLVPAAFGLSALYPWMTPERLDPEIRELVRAKSAYLNLPFFGLRSALYVAAWLAILLRLRRWSDQQDRGARPGPLTGFCAAAAIVFGLTLTFASFDWLMSLRPEWSSTIYGIRVFAATTVPALALLAVVMRRSALPVTAGHAHALSSLLQVFVLFWFYIAFSQLLVVWIGNVPREITWYLARNHGVWLGIGVLLLIGHFVLPFLLLLFKPIKRSPEALARLGVWLLVMHYVDICWLVVPEGNIHWWLAAWIYPAALALVAGAGTAMSVWWMRGRPAVPARDPDLAVSLEYEYEES